MRVPVTVFLVAILVVPVSPAADLATAIDYSRSERIIEGYFRKQTRQIADDCSKNTRPKNSGKKLVPNYDGNFWRWLDCGLCPRKPI